MDEPQNTMRTTNSERIKANMVAHYTKQILKCLRICKNKKKQNKDANEL